MSLVLAVKDRSNKNTLGYIKSQEGKFYKSQDEKVWEECTWLETRFLFHDKGLRRWINE